MGDGRGNTADQHRDDHRGDSCSVYIIMYSMMACHNIVIIMDFGEYCCSDCECKRGQCSLVEDMKH